MRVEITIIARGNNAVNLRVISNSKQMHLADTTGQVIAKKFVYFKRDFKILNVFGRPGTACIKSMKP